MPGSMHTRGSTRGDGEANLSLGDYFGRKHLDPIIDHRVSKAIRRLCRLLPSVLLTGDASNSAAPQAFNLVDGYKILYNIF